MHSVPAGKNGEQLAHQLIPIIQAGFPLVSRPFQALAERAGSTERKVIDALIAMKDSGIIRALGPVFDPRKLGYVSTLAAAKVDDHGIERFAAAVIEINEITHAYLRDNEYNVWFTVTALDAERLGAILERCASFPGVRDVLNLPTKRVFKISAVWGSEVQQPSCGAHSTDVYSPNESEKKLVRTLQKQVPLTEMPFAAIAGTGGTDEETVLSTLAAWCKNGVIRRFGARLNHRKIGYTENILAAWKGPDVVDWGERFANMESVSHCYLRESRPNWPYELYTMIHARSADEARNILSGMKDIAVDSDVLLLKTIHELKKTVMKYFMEV